MFSQTYKGISYQIEEIVLPESIKMIGISHRGLEQMFANIEMYHNRRSAGLANLSDPYQEIGLSASFGSGEWDYIFGGQVCDLSDVPEGMIGIDLGVRAFAVITFCAPTAFELVGGAEAGDAMKIMGEYIKNVWLPENPDRAMMARDSISFPLMIGGRAAHGGIIEVYHTDIQTEPAMQFYIPLAEGAAR